MNCEHPKACLDEHGDCSWCEEVASLQMNNAALQKALHGKAVILSPGKHTIQADTIGYLVCMSGSTVMFERVDHADSLVVLPGATVGACPPTDR